METGESIRHPRKLFIGGQWVDPLTDAVLDVINPVSEKVHISVAEAREEDVERAVSAARNAFDHGPWPRMSPADRAVYLLRLADELDRLVEPMSSAWTIESGTLQRDTKAMSAGLGATFRYYAGLAETFAFETRHEPVGGGVGLLVREPVGVVAAIVAWNAAPFLIANKVAPALLAGCTVVVKAPPSAPIGAYLFVEACERAGLPEGVVNLLTAELAASEALVRHPGIDKVGFTGSTAAGRRILSICGERIARCTLELGGKSPAVVLDDYDIAAAADVIAAQSVFMTGQVCSSLTRVVVSRRRHDAMVEALASRFQKLTVGDPFDQSSDMGPLAMARQRDRVEEYVRLGQQEGARIATGGNRPRHLDQGFFIEPTVLAGVDNNWRVAREEIFGPVLCVVPAETEDAALDLANDTIFGLNSSVFTNDVERAYRAARRIRAGTVGHNGFRSDFSIAFGGFKQSGIGREGGLEGLMPYLETKTVILQSEPKAWQDKRIH